MYEHAKELGITLITISLRYVISLSVSTEYNMLIYYNVLQSITGSLSYAPAHPVCFRRWKLYPPTRRHS